MTDDFWEWLPKAYGEVGDEPVFTKYNMEVAFAAGAEAEAKRMWQGLTDDEVKGPIQRAMQHFGYDPTQYSLGGAATIGFYGLVKEIEAKLREKNT